jgi:hypothetical protein
MYLAFSGRLDIAAWCCYAPQRVTAKRIYSPVAELLRESVNPAVGWHVQMVLSGDDRGKMAETVHRWLCAGEQRRSIIAAERMQPIITFGTNHPDNRIRAAVGGRYYRRASSTDRAAPGG